MTDDELVVEDHPAEQQYVARIGDRVVGFTEYRRIRGRLVFFHTEVDPAVEGQGIGSRLAAGTLDDVRARGLKIAVKCPFLSAYFKRHRQYDDLLADPGTAQSA